MKALVTGGSGFIGSTLIDRLVKQGIEVRALMRSTSSDAHLRNVPYEKAIGDITDFESLRVAVQGVDLVFHLAGAIMAPKREDYFRFNAQGTANLARAVAEHASGVKRFVFVSSLAAGGPSPSSEPRKESDADRAVSAYGESKWLAEQELLAYRERFHQIIVRPPTVYGPRDKATLTLVRIAKRRIIPLLKGRTASGLKYYSVVHAEDLVDAILKAGMAGPDRIPSGEKFYVSSDVLSQEEMMDQIGAALGKPALLKFRLPVGVLDAVARGLAGVGKIIGKTFFLSPDKMNEVRPDYWVCSNAKAETLLGFHPRVRSAEGFRSAVEWYRRNRWI